MRPERLEAFSDGVIAVIITIMVLEMKVPKGPSLADLRPLLPIFLSYLMSFVYVGIYWNNHHHLLQATEKISGAVLWANMHLLFWLSLFPFVTGWVDQNHIAALPVALYGVVLMMAAVAFSLLARIIVRGDRENAKLGQALGDDYKSKISMAAYLCGIALAYIWPWLGLAIYAIVAVIWFIPDRRIEEVI